MSERTLPRGVVAGVGMIGFIFLVLAARTDGYWQALLINLGTGALLFAALEQMLFGALQAIAPLQTEKLEQLQQELEAVDQMNIDERMKRMSRLWVLADKYGAPSLRAVMAARPSQAV